MDEYVKEHGFAGWFETSAKENINIDEAARALVNKVSTEYTYIYIRYNIKIPSFMTKVKPKTTIRVV